jgi:hypothetical protein
MEESKSKSWLTLFIIPLVIGLIIALFTFVVPKLFEKGKKLNYSVDGPSAYLDKNSIGNIKVVVNDVPTANLFGYKVRLWNSGGVPLKNLPILFNFSQNKPGLVFFSVSHDTKPSLEFGGIREEGSDDHSKRFVYELLNPGDEDVVTFLLNDNPKLQLYSKSEGLKLVWVRPSERGPEFLLSLVGGITGMLASFLSLIFYRLRLRRTRHLLYEREISERKR